MTDADHLGGYEIAPVYFSSTDHASSPYLPFHSLVEARGLQLFAERFLIDLNELHALARQIGLERLALLQDVGALIDRGLVEIFCDDVAHVGGQPVPYLGVGQEPEAIPHMVGLGEILLHFVQFGEVNDRERILLAFSDLSLQRRIDFGKIDRHRSRVERLEHRRPQRARWDADLEALEVVRRL